jgi:ParB-like chromosome segregation protein Spo0J
MTQQAIDLTALEPHPFADIFPRLRDDHLRELAASIERDGLIAKIVLFQGKILDGRNRYAALQMLGVAVTMADHFTVFGGTEAEALDYVESTNLVRRHLNETQRAKCAVDFARLRGVPITHANAKHIARQFGTSVHSMQAARDVMVKVPANISKLMGDGDLRMRQAQRIADRLTPEQQRRIKTPEQAQRALEKIKPRRFDDALPGLILRIICDGAAELRERPPCDVLSGLQGQHAIELQEIETAIGHLRVLHDEMADALRDPHAFRAKHMQQAPAPEPTEAA